MVSTSSVKEIKDLFGQVLQKVEELVGEVDEADLQLNLAAMDLFREAVKVVIPVIRYVDHQLDVGDRPLFRGIWIDDNTGLTRKGEIFSKHSPNSLVHYLEYRDYDRTDVLVDRVIERLNRLGQAFNQALSKLDDHRTSLAERNDTLQKATAVFKQ